MTTTTSTHSIKSGKRFIVTFYNIDGSEACSWTGRKVGKSSIPGRIAVKGEYVDWKRSCNIVPEGEAGHYTVIAIDRNFPAFYRDGRVEVTEIDRTEGIRTFEQRAI